VWLATADRVALDLAEPQLNLVQPGGVGRGEVQMDIAVIRQEVANQFGFVGGEVVENDVDLLSLRLGRHQRTEEGDEFGAGMVGRGVPNNFPGPGVESRVKGQG
jgi:hypothetical protein